MRGLSPRKIRNSNNFRRSIRRQ